MSVAARCLIVLFRFQVAGGDGLHIGPNSQHEVYCQWMANCRLVHLSRYVHGTCFNFTLWQPHVSQPVLKMAVAQRFVRGNLTCSFWRHLCRHVYSQLQVVHIGDKYLAVALCFCQSWQYDELQTFSSQCHLQAGRHHIPCNYDILYTFKMKINIFI